MFIQDHENAANLYRWSRKAAGRRESDGALRLTYVEELVGDMFRVTSTDGYRMHRVLLSKHAVPNLRAAAHRTIARSSAWTEWVPRAQDLRKGIPFERLADGSTRVDDVYRKPPFTQQICAHRIESFTEGPDGPLAGPYLPFAAGALWCAAPRRSERAALALIRHDDVYIAVEPRVAPSEHFGYAVLYLAGAMPPTGVDTLRAAVISNGSILHLTAGDNEHVAFDALIMPTTINQR